MRFEVFDNRGPSVLEELYGMYYTLALASEITAAAAVVMAVAAVAALAIQFWTSPKPLNAKVAVIRTSAEISCLLMIILGITLASQLPLAPIPMALYVIVVQSILFLTAGGDMNRFRVVGYMMSMMAPLCLMMLVIIVVFNAQIKDLKQVQDRTTDVLKEVVKVLSSGSAPSPSPSPVTR
jgi:hypothetical protein